MDFRTAPLFLEVLKLRLDSRLAGAGGFDLLNHVRGILVHESCRKWK